MTPIQRLRALGELHKAKFKDNPEYALDPVTRRYKRRAPRPAATSPRRTGPPPPRVVYHGTPVGSVEQLARVLALTELRPRSASGHKGDHWGGVMHSNPEMVYFSTSLKESRRGADGVVLPGSSALLMHDQGSPIGIGVVFANAGPLDTDNVYPDEDYIGSPLGSREKKFEAQARMQGQWKTHEDADSLAHRGPVAVRVHGYTVARWSATGEDAGAKRLAKEAEGRVKKAGGHYLIPHTERNAELLRELAAQREQDSAWSEGVRT